jgi:hypothetical protein
MGTASGAVVTHTSDAHALIRETARSDRDLTERQLRELHTERVCMFLSTHTGLPFADVVEIYEQEQHANENLRQNV